MAHDTVPRPDTVVPAGVVTSYPRASHSDAVLAVHVFNVHPVGSSDVVKGSEPLVVPEAHSTTAVPL